MSNFDFKKVLKENLYNLNYSGDDKIRVVLNEGKTLLVEREIHEGIMDLLKGFTRTQPGWEKELERQIDAWLEKSALEDARKSALKSFYMRNLESLPPSFYEDEENLEQVEDSLNAAEEGDVDKAAQELEDAVESAEDGESDGEQAKAEKGESLKAQKGDLVIVKSGGNQFLLRIGDIVGGEEEKEPESRRGSQRRKERYRRNRNRNRPVRLGSAGLGEGILRLNEQEYMIDAGMLLNTGNEYLPPKKTVDLTIDIARIATDGDIAKIKEKYPEQFERFFASQKEPTADGTPDGGDIKAGDWVRYTNNKGQKMLVRISNRMDLNPTGPQRADRPAKWGGRFLGDVLINLDTGRVSFSGPYSLETKDAEKAEDSFVEKTKQSNPKIQRAIDRVDARKSKEDTATELVDKNASKLIAALLDDTKLTSTVRNQFRNYLNSLEGIKIATTDSVDPIIDLIKAVIANPIVRTQLARVAAKAEKESGNKNESKKYLKKVVKESIKGYIKHENRKQLKS